MINMNVNHKNREVIFDSVKMLAGMGVDLIRIIKTAEAPRWVLNAGNNIMTHDEYYNFSAEFAERYKNTPGLPPVFIWQSLYLDAERREFTCFPVKTSRCGNHEDNVICTAIFDKPSVLANGEITPCTSVAGLFAHMGIHMENVKTEGLQKVLTEGRFISAVTQTVGKKLRANEKCSSCIYSKACQGGCPALSSALGGSLLSPDEYKCAFFFGGWYEKYCKVLGDWKNLNPME
jgi:radical SAM protein with 4Fe4S-binding SPASM domain